MNTDTLRVFVEVVRRGGFSAVARQRNVDPSSISRGIASLEEELGVRLFQRTTRRVVPTDAARAYFDRVEHLIDELEQASTVAKDHDDEPRGPLRITAPISFAQVNLVPLLPGFSKSFPLVSFDLVFTDTFLDLVGERIDLAIRLGRLADSSLVAHRLAAMRYALCASPRYLRERRAPRTPSDLATHDCLHYQVVGAPAVWRFRAAADAPVTEVRVRGRVVATNGMTLKQCAVAGMGLLLLPRWNVAEELRSGALVTLLPEYEATLSDFDGAAWMIYPSRSYLPRKVRVFADYLKEAFAAGSPAERGLGAGSPPRRRSTRSR
ncbi:MAG: LysR substrate-binding domain-containing protein [Kofleriaceae bacterium]|nr:LysR substrate-binding domain-containing protein [Kofleriaceae bacterium]